MGHNRGLRHVWEHQCGMPTLHIRGLYKYVQKKTRGEECDPWPIKSFFAVLTLHHSPGTPIRLGG